MSEKAKSNTMIPHVKLFRKLYVLQVSLSYFSLNDYRVKISVPGALRV